MAGILELRRVSKQFPEHLAVNNASFAVDPGELFGLLGPSGCGKTTVLRLVAGFEDATTGDILLSGSRVNAQKPYERNVSTVFQNYALFPHLTVRKNIEFGLKRDQLSRADELLQMLQLDGKGDRKPAALSGGEKQRVALARSLAMRPDVLLLDEPLSALDPLLRKEVRSDLKALQRRLGVSFVFVTHDREEALSLCDRIAVMHKGSIEQIGSPEELYRNPRTRFVAEFLGPVNWVDGVGVRPESVRLTRELSSASGTAAVVESSTFLGSCVHVGTRLRTGDKVVAEIPSGSMNWRLGEPVHVSWQATDELRIP